MATYFDRNPTPGVAQELRTLTTSSTTFSASLLQGQGYIFSVVGASVVQATGLFTLNGSVPTSSAGTGSIGMPVPQYGDQCVRFYPTTGQTTLIALTTTGSATGILTKFNG